MSHIRRPSVLILFLLVFCVGCGNQLERSANQYMKSVREFCDILESIRDKASLNANAEKAKSKFEEVCALEVKLKKMRGKKSQIERLSAKIRAQERETSGTIIFSMTRIATISGGKELLLAIAAISERHGLLKGRGGAFTHDIPGFNPGHDPGQSIMDDMQRRQREETERFKRQTEEFHRKTQESLQNLANQPMPGPFGNQMPSHGSYPRPNTSRPQQPAEPTIDLSGKTPEELVGFFTYHDPKVAIDAVERINRVSSDSVSSDLRRKIAQGLKQIADDRTNDPRLRAAAMQGMVTWGKKYSTPLLIELLDENCTFQQQKIILGALNDFKDYSAIEPVAKILAQGNSNLYAASTYLAKVGPNAEKAVLDYVRPTSLELTKETVQLLGKIGSRKSLAAFVRLKKSPYYHLIEQDVREAKQAVLDRMKKD